MTVKELTEAIETTLLRLGPLTPSEIVARFDNQDGLTQYNIVATLRGMKLAGRLTESKGKLYLQRGFGAE